MYSDRSLQMAIRLKLGIINFMLRGQSPLYMRVVQAAYKTALCGLHIYLLITFKS